MTSTTLSNTMLINTTLPTFSYFTLSGNDSIKFLQGQVTCNIDKLTVSDEPQTNTYQATAISNLKGRVQFGIWIAKTADNQYNIVCCADCADAFSVQVKKFGAFSKVSLTESQPIYPCVMNNEATFSIDNNGLDENENNREAWARKSIETGNYWITAHITDVFQPQELRLHQRGGIDYDKGCYLGQEVIARIYFKSSPKSFLHRISGTGKVPLSGDSIGEKNRIKVVNAISIDSRTNSGIDNGTDSGIDNEINNRFEALVITRPDILDSSDEFVTLEMPSHLMLPVARNG